MKHLYITTIICVALSIFSTPVNSKNLRFALDRFWSVSCDYAKEIEKFIPNTRSGRSMDFEEEPNLEDPEELFNYLYPLADLTLEDFIKQENEKARTISASNTIYAWTTDLGHLWLSECRKRLGVNIKEGEELIEENGDYYEFGREEENHSTNSGVPRHGTMYSEYEEPEINYRNKRSAPRNLSHSSSVEEFISSSSNEVVYSPNSTLSLGSISKSQKRITTRNRSHNKTSHHRHHHRRKDSSSKGTKFYNILGSATEATEEVTTTAAPAMAEDHFFSSYGGDIEYFFPLLSFGIPFDGEITFLGFHGFKGLFPY